MTTERKVIRAKVGLLELAKQRQRQPSLQDHGVLVTHDPNRTNGLRSLRRHPAQANVGGDAMNPPRVR